MLSPDRIDLMLDATSMKNIHGIIYKSSKYNINWTLSLYLKISHNLIIVGDLAYEMSLVLITISSHANIRIFGCSVKPTEL